MSNAGSEGWTGRLRTWIPPRWIFGWRYLCRRTPWDTGITPPEVMEFIEGLPIGKALDLGCGTGTNAMTLARRGWRVTGVDFAPGAVRKARRKAARAGLGIEFLAADVTELSSLTGGYDYALDIGCLHSLPEQRHPAYAAGLARLVRPGGWYMLYAWFPGRRGSGNMGLTPDEVESLLRAEFSKIREAIGEERGHPTAWYWYRRR